MKIIWAPWRMDYILGKKERGCVFCTRLRRRNDRKDLILHRGRWNFVMLNRYPYNNGHLMVVPHRHLGSLEGLRLEERVEMMDLIVRSTGVMKKALRPQGFNVGINLGKAAGAGIDDHLHFHVVPRWQADTNFWPVLSACKALPEHLFKTYDRLKKNWRSP